MKATKHVTIGLFALYMVSFLVAFIPTGAAQGTDKTLEISESAAPTEIKDRLAPETSQVSITYSFKVTVPPVGACIDTISIEFTPPPQVAYIVSSLSPRQITQNFEGEQSFVSGGSGKDLGPFTTKLTVQFTREAPAFKPQLLEVKALARGGAGTSSGCNFKDSTQVGSQASVIPDYAARVLYQPKSYTQNSGQNKQVAFAVTMINFSNGPTKVTTSIVEKDKGLDGIIPPVTTLLESKAFTGATARDTQEVFITARTPHNNGYSNKIYTFDAVFDATADTTSETGEISKDQKVVTMSVKVQGVYVPGFDVGSVVGALGIALVGIGFARRRIG